MTEFAQKLSEGVGAKGFYPAIERAFDGLGMMQGSLAPIKRAAFGAGLGYIIGEAIRPSWSHTSSGAHRPWLYLSGDNASGTLLPWWTLPVAGAFVCAVLI